jgi:hypothetical protein
VHTVSIANHHAHLLDEWFEDSLRPLLAEHQRMAAESTARKIGLLKAGIDAVIRARTGAAEQITDVRREGMRRAESNLRRAAGAIPQAENRVYSLCDGIRELGPIVTQEVASAGVELLREAGSVPAARLDEAILASVAGRADQVYRTLQELSTEMQGALVVATRAIASDEAPTGQNLQIVLRDMPRFVFASGISLTGSWMDLLGRRFSEARIARTLERVIGLQLESALAEYARALQSWARGMLREIQHQFDSGADPYRVQLARLGKVERNPSGWDE